MRMRSLKAFGKRRARGSLLGNLWWTPWLNELQTVASGVLTPADLPARFRAQVLAQGMNERNRLADYLDPAAR